MILDHTHFKTNDGIVFTTRGFYHPENKVRAVPLYKLASKGNGLEKRVDEFGDKWFYQVHPDWIQDSPFGRGIFVPVSEISETYNPFESKRIIQGIKDETSIQIIAFLQKIGIDRRDIGFLGSYLFDTGKKPHDVDLVIRGLDNLILIRKNFEELLRRIHGRNYSDEEYIKKSIPRYEQKYNRDFNDFAGMIARRWPTIYVPDKFFGKLRFTYKPHEIPILEQPKGNALINENISGEITNDLETSFMPRQFQLRLRNKQIRVMTYFWDFSYCVSSGDKVTIKGDYYPKNETLLLSNPKQHGLRFGS